MRLSMNSRQRSPRLLSPNSTPSTATRSCGVRNGRRQIIGQVEQRTTQAGFLRVPARNDRSPRACATQREAPWAIDLGTHAGVPSSHLSSVIGLWLEPSAFITNSSAYG